MFQHWVPVRAQARLRLLLTRLARRQQAWLLLQRSQLQPRPAPRKQRPAKGCPPPPPLRRPRPRHQHLRPAHSQRSKTARASRPRPSTATFRPSNARVNWPPAKPKKSFAPSSPLARVARARASVRSWWAAALSAVSCPLPRRQRPRSSPSSTRSALAWTRRATAASTAACLRLRRRALLVGVAPVRTDRSLTKRGSITTYPTRREHGLAGQPRRG